MKKRVHVWISGIVQGVFFRHNIALRAEKIGIKGFARNTEDGKVEVVAEGEDAAIKKLLQFCSKGPNYARVDNIEVKEETYTGEFKDFKVLHI